MPTHFENSCPYSFSYFPPSAKDCLTSPSITPNGSCSSPNTHVTSPLSVTIPSPPPSDDRSMQGTDSLLLCALPKTEPELRTWSVFQGDSSSSCPNKENFFKKENEFETALCHDVSPTHKKLGKRKIWKAKPELMEKLCLKNSRSAIMLQLLVDLLSNGHHRDIVDWTGRQPLEFTIHNRKSLTAMWNSITGKEDSFMAISCIMRAMGNERVWASNGKHIRLISWTSAYTYRFFSDYEVVG
ncbi:ETS domain-containing protein [Trichostrongylus colubriformis]|uniref:ETS domain-containing protein n=1 Tax=Trichostrongylus colubriformis TaxID=6319 RepID=A0AAN8F213_TRICO